MLNRRRSSQSLESRALAEIFFGSASAGKLIFIGFSSFAGTAQAESFCDSGCQTSYRPGPEQAQHTLSNGRRLNFAQFKTQTPG